MSDSSKENNEIHIVGEQAEVFDQQMDADRDWFESTSEAFYFRPEIEGEFNDFIVGGGEPPCVYAVAETDEGDKEVPGGWVCVVDIGRYVMRDKEPSGCRMRIRTSAPITGVLREKLLEGVCQYVDKAIQISALSLIKSEGDKKKSSGKGFG